MTMTPGVRKLALTAHVTSSVGWLGAAAAFLALAGAGLTSADARTTGAAYLAMDVITWVVIVPASVAALVTGLVQSLGTTWGVVRHYWVVVKLLLTVLAIAVLLLHTRPIRDVARAAAETTLSRVELRRLRIQLVVDAGAGLAVLLATTALSVYKPRGVTRYGWRKYTQHGHRIGSPGSTANSTAVAATADSTGAT